MCHRLPRTHVNSDQRVCLSIATVLIFSAMKTNSFCDDNKHRTFVELQYNGLRMSTAKHNECGTMASRCSDQTDIALWIKRYRAATGHSIDSNDITVARNFFSDNSDVCGDDDERDVYRSNDKSHVLISTGVSKRKKKTDAFEC